ncbi:efflux RND transporter periplasmic adaptor subunit [Allisonella histaminiformans]|uniref:Membrane fusion protein, multidrug efflux system n=1 Tax=Allisonella histaminiformans TaxID=209880 RepID=A0A1G5W509_9FIRM|nr:efflux RND transporter periplasmic adaptor subunit [Allisonella histaminiformans]PWL46773.1 MAG: efflux RND transporter periplasmic adaptor subunit [Veillonellaceae bacterium]MCI6002755.1 efflux RND transporter periplasmic adaptor subunit [Allisonella histaminiformans]MDY3957686.1 efflux RND transporter periplasmic adaptor subunit [Allisonella histaminiformans]MDY4539925.1 efflux RND transporter periplasmic adaptor subunit [Allisonella histaminiformans]SDA53024.1 membrane fusion protein, mu
MNYRKWLAATAAAAVLTAGLLSGCGSDQQQAMPNAKVDTFKVFTSDTPIQRQYTGTVEALQEVPVKAKVSGTVTEKYVSGGERVTAGQPLYRLDTRTYRSNLASAQADAARAAATYQNAQTDLARYEKLIAGGAISRQVYDTQKAAVSEYKSAVNAAQAQVQIARDNLNDTIVTAPFTGTLSMDDVNVGTYATAGTTPLVTISSSDPLYVQFDMSEAEYLNLVREHGGTSALGDSLKLQLSDGSEYGYTGKIVQINPSMNGGQISFKAAFPNPGNLLMPGMFTTVVSDSQVAANSLLVPTQAIIPLLDKNMVDVVVGGKVVQKPVNVIGTYGLYSIISSGLNPGDEVIVAGQAKVVSGQAVQAVEVTKATLEKQAKEAMTAQPAGGTGK